jgi:imidazolonepropionase
MSRHISQYTTHKASQMLLTHATLATMTEGYGLMRDAAVAIEGGKITWVGPMADLPEGYRTLREHDCQGRLVTPGLIDCHTHVVFGGSRAAEFEKRLNGASYEEIARAGGGILSTVTATRATTDNGLLTEASSRIAAMAATGTTTVEIKSGYGLTELDELRMLRTARAIHSRRNITVRTTHLAAHALPPEYFGRANRYIDDVVITSLEEAHGERLVDAVDAFCEGIAFSPDQVERVFKAAKALGLPVKIHAEQLSNLGGAALAARYGALSADHLEYMDDDGVAAMAAAGIVAVLLPGAFYTLRETQVPPIAALRAAGVKMAVATDCNPGSSPMTSLPLAMNMACTFFRLTPLEALQGTTVNAAKALGLPDRGIIAPGLRADLCIWNAQDPAELSYNIGAMQLRQRMVGGRLDA